MPLGRGKAGSRRGADVDRVALPADWAGVKAICYDPDDAPRPIECTVGDGSVRFTLPRTHIYKIVLLEKTQ